MNPASLLKQRLAFAACFLATIGAGLLWRSHWLQLPRAVSKYGGDALWALMVYFLVRALWPRRSQWAGAALALGWSFAIELSQLYRAPWIDSVRATRVGHLVLGSTFNAPDLLAYTLGIAAGVVLTARLTAPDESPQGSKHR